ncbi:hypothetical protein K440DRAFT_624364 [Wilcoxina mikolae CBS 423.85]|nr:hypothetical protein K440DRAFT_624364 [Wilcoxina mikolae CBS 423.85]
MVFFPMQLCATFKDSHRGRDHAEFGGLDQKSFLRTFDHISGVVTERGMMCEYERTEMLLRALPKRLWRKAFTKLGMHPLEPSTFDYGKLHSWVTAKITAAETLAMFEFMAPKSPAATEMTPSTSPALTTSASTTPSASLTSASTAPTTSPALPDSAAPIAPMAPPTVVTSPAPTASVTPMAPTISTTAHKSPAATDLTSTSSGTASPMTLTVPTAPIAPTAPMAPTAFTPPARTHTARQGTICAGPTVRLGIIRVEPPQGQKVRRHHYAQPEPIRPHRTESTVTCRSEPAPPTRQEPVKLPRSEPIVPSHSQPVPPCQEPVQQPQQVDRLPCYYCADDQHNLRKCTDLRTDQWYRLLATIIQ